MAGTFDLAYLRPVYMILLCSSFRISVIKYNPINIEDRLNCLVWPEKAKEFVNIPAGNGIRYWILDFTHKPLIC